MTPTTEGLPWTERRLVTPAVELPDELRAPVLDA